MKKNAVKKILSAILTVVMLLSAVPLSGFAGLDLFGVKASAAYVPYRLGDIFSFGSYPQSRVTNSSTLSGLGSLLSNANWISYGYYEGTGDHSTMTPTLDMKYVDLTYNGAKYRAVRFSENRPDMVYYKPSTYTTTQQRNGYSANMVYYFKFEPIKWRVLDPSTGLVMCETCIDSQAFSNLVYEHHVVDATDYNLGSYSDPDYTHPANDYATSSIRAWLNADFYNTAFNSTEKGKILNTTLESTTDKVFLLSIDEVTNTSYGFSDSSTTFPDWKRRGKCTDYALAQGCERTQSGEYDGNVLWHLRSRHDNETVFPRTVQPDGAVAGRNVAYSTIGVRPAIKINLPARTFTGLTITKQPTKTVYTSGEYFESIGMVVEAVYSDGATSPRTDYTVANSGKLTKGQTAVTISYTENGITQTTSIPVTVNDAPLRSIGTFYPTKTHYFAGENFDPAGMVVKAYYTDGTDKEITNYTLSNNTNLALGQTSVTVSYTERGVTKENTVIITVTSPLTSISVTTPPTKTTYLSNANFSKTGMVVTAYYADGTSKDITNYTIINGANMPFGQTSVTVSYTEYDITKTTTVPITIESSLTAINVVTPPDKTAYLKNENFDPTGMVVEATYGNGTTATITDYTVTNGSNLFSGQSSVTLSYEENGITKTTTVPITVKYPLDYIVVTTQPTKTQYVDGDWFERAGMVVKAYYTDRTSAVVTDYKIVNSVLTYGQTSVTISYTELGTTRTTTVPITVTPKVTAISVITPPEKTSYVVGESFKSAGMVVEAAFSDGSKRIVTDYRLLDNANLRPGQDEVRIEYYGGATTPKTAKVQITVSSEYELEKIIIAVPPTKTEYKWGDYFNKSGMMVAGVYSNGNIEFIWRNGFTISNENEVFTEEHNTVTVSFTDNGITKTVEVPITVTAPQLWYIYVDNKPTKTSYYSGESFDPTGMIVIAKYSNGYTREVTSYTVLNGDMLEFRQSKVTISYTENGVTQEADILDIRVDRARVKCIEMETPPLIEFYAVGQTIDINGIKLIAYRTDGTSTIIERYNCSVVGERKTVAGQTFYTVECEFENFTETFTIPITVHTALTKISVTTPPYRTVYYQGEDFDPTGMIVTATYKDGVTQAVKTYTITNGSSLSSSSIRVTISYKEGSVTKTATVSINVVSAYSSILVDTLYSVSKYSPSIYMFTPETSGFYSFVGDQSGAEMSLFDENMNFICSDNDGDDNKLTTSLVAGKKYYYICTINELSVFSYKFNVVHADVVNGSGAVIDFENKLIYGLAPGLTSFDGFISATENYTISAADANSMLGTGSVLVITSSSNQIIDKFTAVVYGDVNGDGWYDGQDSMIVSCILTGMLTREQIGEAAWLAADCDHSGAINDTDVYLLQLAGILLDYIDRRMSTEELITTSAYNDYVELIDQNLQQETEKTPEAPKEEEASESEPIFLIIIKYLIKYINIIFSFFNTK